MHVTHPSAWGRSLIQRGISLVKSSQPVIVTAVGGHILQWVGEQPDSAPIRPAARTRSARLVKTTVRASRTSAKPRKKSVQTPSVSSRPSAPLTSRPPPRSAPKPSAPTQMAKSFAPSMRPSTANAGVDLSNLIQEMDRAMAIKWWRDHFDDEEIL